MTLSPLFNGNYPAEPPLLLEPMLRRRLCTAEAINLLKRQEA